jgi:hypothetical protein
VGRFRGVDKKEHGYVLSDGQFTSFDLGDGSTCTDCTAATGTNSDGDIVGNYTVNNHTYGYLKSGGNFTIDYPGGSTRTAALKINSNGTSRETTHYPEAGTGTCSRMAGSPRLIIRALTSPLPWGSTRVRTSLGVHDRRRHSWLCPERWPIHQLRPSRRHNHGFLGDQRRRLNRGPVHKRWNYACPCAERSMIADSPMPVPTSVS